MTQCKLKKKILGNLTTRLFLKVKLLTAVNILVFPYSLRESDYGSIFWLRSHDDSLQGYRCTPYKTHILQTVNITNLCLLI